jgi:hypothetical protein
MTVWEQPASPTHPASAKRRNTGRTFQPAKRRNAGRMSGAQLPQHRHPVVAMRSCGTHDRTGPTTSVRKFGDCWLLSPCSCLKSVVLKLVVGADLRRHDVAERVARTSNSDCRMPNSLTNIVTHLSPLFTPTRTSSFIPQKCAHSLFIGSTSGIIRDAGRSWSRGLDCMIGNVPIVLRAPAVRPHLLACLRHDA